MSVPCVYVHRGREPHMWQTPRTGGTHPADVCSQISSPRQIPHLPYCGHWQLPPASSVGSTSCCSVLSRDSDLMVITFILDYKIIWFTCILEI